MTILRTKMKAEWLVIVLRILKFLNSTFRSSRPLCVSPSCRLMLIWFVVVVTMAVFLSMISQRFDCILFSIIFIFLFLCLSLRTSSSAHKVSSTTEAELIFGTTVQCGVFDGLLSRAKDICSGRMWKKSTKMWRQRKIIIRNMYFFRLVTMVMLNPGRYQRLCAAKCILRIILLCHLQLNCFLIC